MANVAGTSTFRIEQTRSDGRQTLAPSGELDSGSYPALIEAFDRAAAELDGDELHLDLGALAFIDSAGLRALIQLQRSAGERGIELVVTPPAPPLTDLLQMTGVASRLTLSGHHSPVFKPFVERLEIELPAELRAPGLARVEVRQAASAMLDEPTLDAAVLLTSELVTNAVIHPRATGVTGATVRLRITCYEDSLRCEISDLGPGFDFAGLVRRVRDTGGRGLLLVDALASRWGMDRADNGDEERFCVWFELDADSRD